MEIHEMRINWTLIRLKDTYQFVGAGSSQHGKCESADKCNCNHDYYGPYCSIKRGMYLHQYLTAIDTKEYRFC